MAGRKKVSDLEQYYLDEIEKLKAEISKLTGENQQLRKEFKELSESIKDKK